MQNKINFKKYAQHDDKLYEFDSEVVSDVEKKEWGYDLDDRSSDKIRIKSMFTVKSLKTDKTINCVLWGNTALKKGQKVRLWGKIRGNETSKCLVVYKYYIL